MAIGRVESRRFLPRRAQLARRRAVPRHLPLERQLGERFLADTRIMQQVAKYRPGKVLLSGFSLTDHRTRVERLWHWLRQAG